MEFKELELKGVFLIKPVIHRDERGYFFESFRQDLFEKHIGEINFVQDNESYSVKGVFRGLHYQIPPKAQSKLVRVVKGRIIDVVLDIRRNSPTFLKYITVELNDDNKYQLFIPHGFAHGFYTLSEYAIVHYKVDEYYSPEHERGINIKSLPIKFNGRLILSNKDSNLPLIEECEFMGF